MDLFVHLGLVILDVELSNYINAWAILHDWGKILDSARGIIVVFGALVVVLVRPTSQGESLNWLIIHRGQIPLTRNDHVSLQTILLLLFLSEPFASLSFDLCLKLRLIQLLLGLLPLPFLINRSFFGAKRNSTNSWRQPLMMHGSLRNQWWQTKLDMVRFTISLRR